ncbi:hypothetical protein N658DRAFT_258282 [Parathielavia hyrcaniae]|uniref:Uncharacterized protein n=1 Tax=Parathielavia hyrcaniae TaxID=113614 RepID=A0AAN6PYV7_9PEZI|nr:hypothetical protein N658DRAFT_258282 [Parathielavia hyrcaniae]
MLLACQGPLGLVPPGEIKSIHPSKLVIHHPLPIKLPALRTSSIQNVAVSRDFRVQLKVSGIRAYKISPTSNTNYHLNRK